MLEKQSITRNSFFALGSGVIQKLMTLAYFIIVARTFGPEDQGSYSAALAFTALFGILIDHGLSAALTRETARDTQTARKNASQVLLMKTGLGVIVYGLIVGSAVALQYPPVMIQLIALAGAATFIDVISTSCWGIVRGFQNLWYESWGGILAIGVMMTTGISAIAFDLPIHALIGAVFLGSFSNFLLVLFVLFRRMRVPILARPDSACIRHLFAISMPFAGAALFSRIYTFIDTALVARLASPEAAGLYSAGNKLILALNIIPAAISSSLYPALSSLIARDPSRLGPTFVRALRYLLLAVAPVAAGTAILADDIVAAFYGAAYAPTGFVLRLLLPAIVFGFLSYPPGALLAASGNQKKNTVIFGIAAAINVVLNLALIPWYAEQGAAIAASATYTAIFLLSMIATYTYWKAQVREFAGATFRIGFSTLGMSVALDVLHTPWLVWNIFVGVGAYACMLFVTGVVTLSELSGLMERIKKPHTSVERDKKEP